MRTTLCRAFLGASLLALLACNGGGDSEAPTLVTGPGSMPSSTTAVFDPSAGAVPLPNVLVTATTTSVTYTGVSTPAPGTLNIVQGVPLTPDKALAYVNLKEMGGTHAVSGLNAPIYIQFTGAVDASTVTAANLKVFQVVPDVPADPSSTENNALGFVDVSGLFAYSAFALTPSTAGTGVYLLPKVPLLPGARYLYVVTNRVKDANGLAVSSSVYFEALKSTTTLTGAVAGLEPIRANALVSGSSNVQLSGYAKVMNDLIAASATTTITKRADIALLGRSSPPGPATSPRTRSAPRPPACPWRRRCGRMPTTPTSAPPRSRPISAPPRAAPGSTASATSS